MYLDMYMTIDALDEIKQVRLRSKELWILDGKALTEMVAEGTHETAQGLLGAHRECCHEPLHFCKWVCADRCICTAVR